MKQGLSLFAVGHATSLFLAITFVPEYWNPHSLFDLAQSTGFDNK